MLLNCGVGRRLLRVPWTARRYNQSILKEISPGIFLDFKITADGDYSHEIKSCLLLGRKVMTNLDSILKSKDITLSTKICLVEAMVFQVDMWM